MFACEIWDTFCVDVPFFVTPLLYPILCDPSPLSHSLWPVSIIPAFRSGTDPCHCHQPGSQVRVFVLEPDEIGNDTASLFECRGMALWIRLAVFHLVCSHRTSWADTGLYYTYCTKLMSVSKAVGWIWCVPGLYVGPAVVVILLSL